MIGVLLHPVNEPLSLFPATLIVMAAIVSVVTSRDSFLWMGAALAAVPFAFLGQTADFVWLAGPWFVAAGIVLALQAERIGQAIWAALGGAVTALLGNTIIARIALLDLPIDENALLRLVTVSALTCGAMALIWMFLRRFLGSKGNPLAELAVAGGILSILDAGRSGGVTCLDQGRVFCASQNQTALFPLEVCFLASIALVVLMKAGRRN